MVSATNRRDFLGILLGGAAGLSLPSRVFGQRPAPAASITPTLLSDNLIHFTGAGGNVVVATGPDGLVMVNGGRQEMSADLLEAMAEHTGGKRVQALFNTDWHREHTGSNETLGKAGATIIAHEHTRQYLGAEIYVDWQNRTYKPLPPHALPNQTFYTSGTLTGSSAAERIEYGHLGQAHTDAAIYVFFPAANVLVAGDALSVGKYPIADYTTGGWLGGLLAANKTLLGLANAETRIVPGIGPDSDARRPAGPARHARRDDGSVPEDDEAGPGPRRHHRRRPDERVRREVGKSGPVRVHGLSQPVAARARARVASYEATTISAETAELADLYRLLFSAVALRALR